MTKNEVGVDLNSGSTPLRFYSKAIISLDFFKSAAPTIHKVHTAENIHSKMDNAYCTVY